MKKGDETPGLANEVVAREALWSIFLTCLTAEQREKVDALPPEDKRLALHRWVLSTTGSGGWQHRGFEEWLEHLALQ